MLAVFVAVLHANLVELQEAPSHRDLHVQPKKRTKKKAPPTQEHAKKEDPDKPYFILHVGPPKVSLRNDE